jgi:hypothetical protein
VQEGLSHTLGKTKTKPGALVAKLVAHIGLVSVRKRALGRLLTPGSGLVVAAATFLAGLGLGAANVITHDEGLGIAAAGGFMVILLVLWAVFWPMRENQRLAATLSFHAQLTPKYLPGGVPPPEETPRSPEIQLVLDQIAELRGEMRMRTLRGLFTPRYFVSDQAHDEIHISDEAHGPAGHA